MIDLWVHSWDFVLAKKLCTYRLDEGQDLLLDFEANIPCCGLLRSKLLSPNDWLWVPKMSRLSCLGLLGNEWLWEADNSSLRSCEGLLEGLLGWPLAWPGLTGIKKLGRRVCPAWAHKWRPVWDGSSKLLFMLCILTCTLYPKIKAYPKYF